MVYGGATYRKVMAQADVRSLKAAVHSSQPVLTIFLDKEVVVNEPQAFTVAQQLAGDGLPNAPILGRAIRWIGQFLDRGRQVSLETLLLHFRLPDLDDVDVPVARVLDQAVQAGQSQAVGPPRNDDQVAFHIWSLRVSRK
jgi:hypothetical protein